MPLSVLRRWLTVKRKADISLRNRALQYLAKRDYGRAELRAKLLPHVEVENDFEQVQPIDLEALLDDLTARGWLSDERAVSQFVHAKRGRFGTQRIAYELRQKGIADNLIADTLPQLKETELESARNVWQRKFGALPQDQKEKTKQFRFMQSRGFSMDVIIKVLRTLDFDESSN